MSIEVLGAENAESARVGDLNHERGMIEGLLQNPKKISSKYFYDDRGSQIFQQITDLDEYYLTRKEAEVLKTYVQDIFSDPSFSKPFTLLELGAGDGRKTKILLDWLVDNNREFKYVYVDISRHAVEELHGKVESIDPELEQVGLVGDYWEGLDWIHEHRQGVCLALFLGSNIGNYSKEQAQLFFNKMSGKMCEGDFLLTGFDLVKSFDVMERAYSDSEGVTKEFNLNLLTRMNKELKANIDIDKFDHYAFYNPSLGTMESHIVAKEPQEVVFEVTGDKVNFDRYETIHTECSYKYNLSDVKEFALGAKFLVNKNYLDSENFYLNSLWKK